MKKIIFILAILSIFLIGCAEKNQSEKPPTEEPLTKNEMKLIPEKGDTIADLKTNHVIKSQMKLIPEKGDTIANLKTNHGEIKILLYTKEAPETAKNFIELSKNGKYNDVIFHRVIKDFMIQGGDFENQNGTGGYSYKGPGTYLKDEFGEGLKHVYGAVSMANAGPGTGGSQFFIVQAKDGTGWLDGVHAIFGYVFEGMDIVEEIAKIETLPNDKPVEDVKIESIEIQTQD